MPDRTYGSHPLIVDSRFDPAWEEYLHYLYLPVVMPGQGDEIRLPRRLEFLRPVVEHVLELENFVSMDDPRFIYVSARRGYATPGNPLNRPGWHADGFGSQDVNYVWSDCFPTRFAVGDLSLPAELEDDHILSAAFWSYVIDGGGHPERRHQVVEGLPKAIYRLTPAVIHATPEIPSPGGNRSFFKISVSPNKYNLKGNSHNYLFDYGWQMYDRDELRNDPSYAGGDAGPQ